MKIAASEKIMENNFHVGNPRRQKDLDLKLFYICKMSTLRSKRFNQILQSDASWKI